MSTTAWVRVAVFDKDGAGGWTVRLYLEDPDSGEFEELDWPEDWPKKVGGRFLEMKGFRCEIA